LAKGIKDTGLSEWIGSFFTRFEGVTPAPIILVVALCITFLTELTSNTGTTETILPILSSVSLAIGKNPLLLMIPATISASCAFMLPVATPPNAIVFGSGHVPMGKMVKAGIILNLIGVGLVFLTVYLLAVPVLNITDVLPAWAR
jgi:sodium-dependent dicarboxylate transporter 2/3/5